MVGHQHLKEMVAMSAIMKRCGYVIVTFLVALGLAGTVTMTGAARATALTPSGATNSTQTHACYDSLYEVTSTSGYSATDDNFVSQPLFFFPHPTKGSGKLVKSYPGEYDPYDSRGYYGLDVLSNDPLGLTAKQLDKIGWDTLGVAKWPSRGALGQPRSDGHDNFAHGRYLYYMPTRAGLDTFAYEKGSKIAGVVCTGTVTVRNVAVQNVEVRAVYKGIVVYNPNPFKVTVEITGSWDPSGVQKMGSSDIRWGSGGESACGEEHA